MTAPNVVSGSSRLKVGILFGGRSAEHEASIRSAITVLGALDTSRYEAIPIAIERNGRWRLQSAQRLLQSGGDTRMLTGGDCGLEVSGIVCGSGRRSAPVNAWDAVFARQHDASLLALDAVFPMLHGPFGEDGTVQGMLELAGIPYVGAGVLGSAVGMDKDVMKRLLRAAGMPVAQFVTVRAYDYQRDPLAAMNEIDALSYPLFVKPANLGSSIGISRVSSRSQLNGALSTAFAYDSKVLAEAAVEGREIECAVVGGDCPVATVAGEIRVTHGDGFYSYDAKYLNDGADLQVPAQIDEPTLREIQRLSIAAFRTLECHGLARVDFFLRPDGSILVNEINTLPGFTSTSMFPRLCAASGIAMPKLLDLLLQSALDRHAKRSSLRSVRSIRT